MTKIIEMLTMMLEQVKAEAITAIEKNDKKKALKILRQINKILPKEYQNELLD